MKLRIALFFTLFLFLFFYVQAQKKIKYKANWSETRPSYPDEIIMVEMVEFEHEGMKMFCDSALFNEKENRFSAYGSIHIIKDTINIWGDELYYEGLTKTAELFGKEVRFEDGNITLITNYLILERIPNTIKYNTGADIFDDKTTMTSRKGIYYMNTKEFEFTKKVDIKTPSAVIVSDTMTYNSTTNIATFFGPTNIVTNDSTYIYTELGWYNTKTDDSESVKASQMINKERLIQADTILYNSQTNIGDAYRNIYMEDTLQQTIVTSHYMHVNNVDTLSYTFITQQALVRKIDKDTLYLHADTIWMNHDTTMHIKDIYAYEHAKFFRTDFQGAAERLYYNMEDSLLTMTISPIMWNEENQITSDTIRININKDGVYGLEMYPNSLIIQNADTTNKDRYNQIFGRHMKGYFDKGQLYRIDVNGNAQTVYYIWDEQKEKTPQLIGVNVGSGSLIKVYIEKKKIKKITTVTDPVFFIDNEDKITQEEKRLKGFEWREVERPLKPEDVFIHRK